MVDPRHRTVCRQGHPGAHHGRRVRVHVARGHAGLPWLLLRGSRNEDLPEELGKLRTVETREGTPRRQRALDA